MLTLLATAADEGGFTLPDNPLGIIIWVAILAVIMLAYSAIKRTRHRAREDYIRHKMWEKQLRDNDPDIKKDDA